MKKKNSRARHYAQIKPLSDTGHTVGFFFSQGQEFFFNRVFVIQSQICFLTEIYTIFTLNNRIAGTRVNGTETTICITRWLSPE